jgi:hypothetical protein
MVQGLIYEPESQTTHLKYSRLDLHLGLKPGAEELFKKEKISDLILLIQKKTHRRR